MTARSMVNNEEREDRDAAESRRLPIAQVAVTVPASLQKLPAHLREAAIRSWRTREEDYRYLADH